MHHDIPEGYYSILEVFDFLGADTFRFSWTGKEVKIGKDDLLSKKLSYTAQWIRRELEAFSLGLYAHSKYGQYIEVVLIDKTFGVNLQKTSLKKS